MCPKHIERLRSRYTDAKSSGVRVHGLFLNPAAYIIKGNNYHKTYLLFFIIYLDE